jgi:hypothetical protein
MRMYQRAPWLAAVWLLTSTISAAAEPSVMLEVGRFASSQAGAPLADGWKPLRFKKVPDHTV